MVWYGMVWYGMTLYFMLLPSAISHPLFGFINRVDKVIWPTQRTSRVVSSISPSSEQRANTQNDGT